MIDSDCWGWRAAFNPDELVKVEKQTVS